MAPSISVSRFVPADPAVVWDLFVDTSRWVEWGPSVTAVELPEVRIRAGSTGRVRGPGGVWVPFEVTEFSDGHHWAWRVAGVPATTHSVEQVPGGCRAAFGIHPVAAPYALVCRAALRRIDRLARAVSGGEQ
jgi:uncharacterized protein YndB with AHSA1/START domain